MVSKLISSRARAVTRADLAAAVYKRAASSRAEAHELVEMMLAEIADALSRGENVKLSTFGSFVVRPKGKRIGRNPKTGVEVPIVARRVVAFKPSKILGGHLNDQDLANESLDV